MNRTCRTVFLTVIAGCIVTMVSLSLAQETELAPGKTTLPLVPVFSTALDGPKLTLDYVNDTNEPVNVISLLSGSSVVIDGKEYSRVVVKYGGRADLPVGEMWPFTIDFINYMPNHDKKWFSTTLGRWRVETPIKSGRHTLLVKFGGKEYGPITFIWEGDLPLLVE